MSLPPHREKDAKAEGRGPPETAKGTMTTFRGLMGRLLKVRAEELKEQQKLYDAERREKEPARPLSIGTLKKRKLAKATATRPEKRKALLNNNEE